MNGLTKDIGDIGWIAAAFGSLSFMAVYTIAAPWWRNPVSRYLWMFGAVVAGIFILSLTRFFLGSLPGLPQIRAVSYVSLAIVIWSAVIGLVRIQILRKRGARRSGDSRSSGE